MHAAQTLAVPRVVVANVKDLRLPAISVGKPTLYLSSLLLAGQCCVVNVSAQVVPHSRESKFFSEAESGVAVFTATTKTVQDRYYCLSHV